MTISKKTSAAPYWYDFAHFGEKPVSHTQREV